MADKGYFYFHLGVLLIHASFQTCLKVLKFKRILSILQKNKHKFLILAELNFVDMVVVFHNTYQNVLAWTTYSMEAL